MTAYLNATELRALADVLDDLPGEFTHGEIQAKYSDTEDTRVAVWTNDEDANRPYVRVVDDSENEAIG